MYKKLSSIVLIAGSLYTTTAYAQADMDALKMICDAQAVINRVGVEAALKGMPKNKAMTLRNQRHNQIKTKLFERIEKHEIEQANKTISLIQRLSDVTYEDMYNHALKMKFIQSKTNLNLTDEQIADIAEKTASKECVMSMTNK